MTQFFGLFLSLSVKQCIAAIELILLCLTHTFTLWLELILLSLSLSLTHTTLLPTTFSLSLFSWYPSLSISLIYILVLVWPDWAIYWTLGNFSKPVATISLPKSHTFSGNFCKGAKIFIFWATLIVIWRLLLVTLIGTYLSHIQSPSHNPTPHLLCRFKRLLLLLLVLLLRPLPKHDFLS